MSQLQNYLQLLDVFYAPGSPFNSSCAYPTQPSKDIWGIWDWKELKDLLKCMELVWGMSISFLGNPIIVHSDRLHSVTEMGL